MSKNFFIVSTLAFTGGSFILPQTMSQAYAAPIEFTHDSNSATQWANMHYGNWRASLSSKELQAIDYYTRGGSSEIEKYLIQTHGAILEERNLVIAKNINLISTALNKKSIPEDITVYSALSSIGWSDLRLLNDPAMRKALIGSVKGEHFMSTYLLREKAPARHAILYLTVPKGTNGAVVGVGSHYEEEKEVLLDRNYEYKITHIDQEPVTNKWRVYAEIVGKWQK